MSYDSARGPDNTIGRVAIVTKDVKGHPVGSRIIPSPSGKDDYWVLADGTSGREYGHMVGMGCEWE